MERSTDIPGKDLEEILSLVHERFGYDLSGYARTSLQRRIVGFMNKQMLQEPGVLKDRLVRDEQCFPAFLQYLTINLTGMFRDPGFFQALREEVIPQLASYPFLKIWHAGCSTGEEVYSMAILLEEEGLLHRTRIYATDINAGVIEMAKQGIFPLRNMQEYTRNYLESGGKSIFSRYYTAKYDHALFDTSLKKNMVFSLHNLASDRSFNEFNLIICRNVLIYFDRDLQNHAVQLFRQSLCMLGYLGLGEKESLTFNKESKYFDTLNSHWKIFRRIQ